MEDQEQKPEEKEQKAGFKKTASRWAMRIITMAVSAAILYYSLDDVEWDKLKKAWDESDKLLALLGATFPLLVFWTTDAAFTTRSFKWFDKPVPFKDYFFIKAAAYLLTMVNITFAAGGVFLYFMRKTGITPSRQAGLLFWRVCMAIFGVCSFFLLVMVYVALFRRDQIPELNLGLWGPLFILIIIFMIEFGLLSLRGKGLFMERLSVNYKGDFWQAFRNARPIHWLLGWLYTLPAILVSLMGLYLVAHAFGIRVPFLYFLFCIPLVSVISALPIAFGQFGTTTVAWITFFSMYGGAEEIAAATLFIPAVKLIFRGGVGLIFMPLAMKELEDLKGKAKPDSE